MEIVTKSAVKNTLVTPLSSTSAEANASSVVPPLTTVPGPPMGTPIENFNAFGFGVGVEVIGIGRGA